MMKQHRLSITLLFFLFSEVTSSQFPAPNLRQRIARPVESSTKKKKNNERRKNLLKKIADLTDVGLGPFGMEWRFVKFGGDGPPIPSVTTGKKVGILDGFLGQDSPPTNVTVPDDMYNTMLKVVLQTARATSKADGATNAELQYHNASELLGQSYKDMFGVAYSGTLWDYLDVYTELNINWIPHVLIWRESDAKKGTPSYLDWLEEQGVEPKSEEACVCSLPPANCRTGGIQVSAKCCYFQ